MDLIEKIAQYKIVPVAVIEKVEDAVPLGKALIKAGLPVVEIVFRTKAAVTAIYEIAKNLPEIAVGAGTVLTVDQVKQAVDAGAQYIVTPGWSDAVVNYCLENNIIIIPGLNTPTFVGWALEKGITFCKFYPADVSGGTRMLKLLAGPYSDMRFMPTGGINNTTMIEYLKLSNVLTVGGSWLLKKDLISMGKFDQITTQTKEALEIIKTSL